MMALRFIAAFQRPHGSFFSFSAGILWGFLFFVYLASVNTVSLRAIETPWDDYYSSPEKWSEATGWVGLDNPRIIIYYRRSDAGQVITVSLARRAIDSISSPIIGEAEIERVLEQSPQLETLYLRNVELAPDTVKPLKKMEYLKSLYLHSCKSLAPQDLNHIPQTIEYLSIEGELQSAETLPIGHLTRLKSLCLWDLPSLSERSYLVLREFPQLEEFTCIRCSGFTNQVFQYLDGKDQLRRVELSGVPVTDSDLPSLVAHPRLEDLSLPKGITADGLRHLAKCKNLRILSVHGSEIDDEAVTVIRSLENLRELNCLMPNIGDNELAVLAEMPNLKKLYLLGGYSPITKAGLARFARQSGVEKLNLAGTSLDSEGFLALREMKNLKELDVMACDSVSGTVFARFAEQSRVEKLNLMSIVISDEEFLSLREMKNLKELNVIGTEVSDEAIKIFRHDRPSIEIITTEDARQAYNGRL